MHLFLLNSFYVPHEKETRSWLHFQPFFPRGNENLLNHQQKRENKKRGKINLQASSRVTSRPRRQQQKKKKNVRKPAECFVQSLKLWGDGRTTIHGWNVYMLCGKVSGKDWIERTVWQVPPSCKIDFLSDFHHLFYSPVKVEYYKLFLLF